MKALLNASTIRFGGGLQVAVSVLRHALADHSGWDWSFAVSKELAAELDHYGPIDPSRIYVFPDSPARSRAARRRLQQFERSLSPDAVLTLFGPAYVDFTAPHLMGVADGWVTHSTAMATRTLPGPIAMADMAARCLNKAIAYRRADAWWVEAECSRQGLQSRLRLDGDRITVIPNSCSESYAESDEQCEPIEDSNTTIKVLTFATGMPNKNLTILPRIAAWLRANAPSRSFLFQVTLPEDGSESARISRIASRLRVPDCLGNLGPIPVADGPQVYLQSHVCLASTLLETSSAFYPEAMAMGRPVVATDLDFARDACGDAALYYKPQDPEDAGHRLLSLVSDPDLWRRLVRRGKQLIASRPGPTERFESLKNALSRLAGESGGERAPAPRLSA